MIHKKWDIRFVFSLTFQVRSVILNGTRRFYMHLLGRFVFLYSFLDGLSTTL